MKSIKDFYHFVKTYDDGICELYDEIKNRKDPEPGDKFMTRSVNIELFGCNTYDTLVYEGVELDGTFDNGTAFYYLFHIDENDSIKIRIRSINVVEDPSKLSEIDKKDLYAFWIKCQPLKS